MPSLVYAALSTSPLAALLRAASLLAQRLRTNAAPTKTTTTHPMATAAVSYDSGRTASASDQGRTLVMPLGSITGWPVSMSMTYVDPMTEPSAARAAAATYRLEWLAPRKTAVSKPRRGDLAMRFCGLLMRVASSCESCVRSVSGHRHSRSKVISPSGVLRLPMRRRP